MLSAGLVSQHRHYRTTGEVTMFEVTLKITQVLVIGLWAALLAL